jgi:hypothetical protein
MEVTLRLTLNRHWFSDPVRIDERVGKLRVVSAIDGPYAESIWYFLKVVSHKIPPILFFVPGLEIGRLVISGRFVGVKEFERRKTTPCNRDESPQAMVHERHV